MKKGGKIACAALACAMLAGTAVGCSQDPEPTPTPEPTAAAVWSTYGTAKVTRNVKTDVPYAKLDAAVDIQMMKDETEGTQIVVTAGDEAIDSYNVTTADLSDGNGHTISKDAISVYHQKYLEVTRKSDPLNTNYVAGDYVPDMLLPLDIAVEYGQNKIAAG